MIVVTTITEESNNHHAAPTRVQVGPNVKWVVIVVIIVIVICLLIPLILRLGHAQYKLYEFGSTGSTWYLVHLNRSLLSHEHEARLRFATATTNKQK